MISKRNKPNGICPSCGSAAIKELEGERRRCERCGETGRTSRFTNYLMGPGEKTQRTSRDVIEEEFDNKPFNAEGNWLDDHELE